MMTPRPICKLCLTMEEHEEIKSLWFDCLTNDRCFVSSIYSCVEWLVVSINWLSISELVVDSLSSMLGVVLNFFAEFFRACRLLQNLKREPTVSDEQSSIREESVLPNTNHFSIIIQLLRQRRHVHTWWVGIQFERIIQAFESLRCERGSSFAFFRVQICDQIMQIRRSILQSTENND